MPVIDTTKRLNLKTRSAQEKYDVVTRGLYINGKPELKGNFAVRIFDFIILKTFGRLFVMGERAGDIDKEYVRVTGNFTRVGEIGRFMGKFGPAGRFIFRVVLNCSVRTIGRQQLFGIDNVDSTVHESAAKYFTTVDFFNFDISIDKVEEDRVEFRYLVCPIGYVNGDPMKVCMATNKWDRQCVRMTGARMILQDLIPEGAPACRGYIMKKTDKVPAEWRRYKRNTI